MQTSQTRSTCLTDMLGLLFTTCTATQIEVWGKAVYYTWPENTHIHQHSEINQNMLSSSLLLKHNIEPYLVFSES